jgi:hypothetical protein
MGEFTKQGASMVRAMYSSLGHPSLAIARKCEKNSTIKMSDLIDGRVSFLVSAGATPRLFFTSIFANPVFSAVTADLFASATVDWPCNIVPGAWIERNIGFQHWREIAKWSC